MRFGVDCGIAVGVSGALLMMLACSGVRTSGDGECLGTGESKQQNALAIKVRSRDVAVDSCGGVTWEISDSGKEGEEARLIYRKSTGRLEVTYRIQGGKVVGIAMDKYRYPLKEDGNIDEKSAQLIGGKKFKTRSEAEGKEAKGVELSFEEEGLSELAGKDLVRALEEHGDRLAFPIEYWLDDRVSELMKGPEGAFSERFCPLNPGGYIFELTHRDDRWVYGEIREVHPDHWCYIGFYRFDGERVESMDGEWQYEHPGAKELKLVRIDRRYRIQAEVNETSGKE